MYILPRIAAGVILSIQSFWDIRYKKIPTIVSVIAGMVGILFRILEDYNFQNFGLALVPGIICFICCFVTRGAVGYGDAILLLSMGCLYSVQELMFICCVSFGAAGVVSMVLLIFYHKRGSYEIPFVPFFWLGWIFEFLGARGGL